MLLGFVLYPYVFCRRGPCSHADREPDRRRTHPRPDADADFFRVALPLARPAIAIGLSLALMEALNDIGAAEFLGVRTLTVSIYTTWAHDPIFRVRRRSPSPCSAGRRRSCSSSGGRGGTAVRERRAASAADRRVPPGRRGRSRVPRHRGSGRGRFRTAVRVPRARGCRAGLAPTACRRRFLPRFRPRWIFASAATVVAVTAGLVIRPTSVRRHERALVSGGRDARRRSAMRRRARWWRLRSCPPSLGSIAILDRSRSPCLTGEAIGLLLLGSGAAGALRLLRALPGRSPSAVRSWPWPSCPRSLDDAAATLGALPRERVWRVHLPLIRPAPWRPRRS